MGNGGADKDVVSSVEETPHEVLMQLCSHIKDVPVIFASLVEFHLIKDKLLKSPYAETAL